MPRKKDESLDVKRSKRAPRRVLPSVPKKKLAGKRESLARLASGKAGKDKKGVVKKIAVAPPHPVSSMTAEDVRCVAVPTQESVPQLSEKLIPYDSNIEPVIDTTAQRPRRDARSETHSIHFMGEKYRAITGTPKLMRKTYGYAIAFIVLVAFVLAGGYAASVANAVTEFISPSQAPPAGNIPVTIWNRKSTIVRQPSLDPKQPDTDIDIDGFIRLGDSDTALGGTPAQYRALIDGTLPSTMTDDDYFVRLFSFSTPNLYPRFEVDRDGNAYLSGQVWSNRQLKAGNFNTPTGDDGVVDSVIVGEAQYAPGAAEPFSDSSDLLLSLRTNDGTSYTDRFTVDFDGNTNIKGSMRSDGCFGAVFVGLSATKVSPSGMVTRGNRYVSANEICQTDAVLSGSHVCTVNEILESMRCATSGMAIRTAANGSQGWVHGGPPGYTAESNDCAGWTSSSSSSYGRFWIFGTNGNGVGTLVSCNTGSQKSFACCR